MSRVLLSSLVLLSVVSISWADDAAVEDKVTYVDDVLPIFRQRCGTCHNANDRKGGLVLDSFAATMEGGSSGTVIEPGSADGSYLWLLVNHDSEPAMPPNSDKLPEAELMTIRQWIEQGTLENSGSTSMAREGTQIARVEISTERPAGPPPIPETYLGEPVTLSERGNAVTALAVNPWSSVAAVSGFEQIAIYDTNTFELLGVLPYPEGTPHIAKFSRNGALLLVGGGRGGASGRVVVFDVRTGARMIEVGDEYDTVLAADISADLTQIALGGPKRMLRVYSAASGELMFEMKKHTDWITAIEFSPDGVLLASGDRSNGLVVWEAMTGREFYNLTGHTAAINDVSWRPDSNALASGSEDGTVRIWEMNNGTQAAQFGAHGGVASVEYTRDGRIVTTGRDRVVSLWQGDGNKIRDFGGMTDLGMDVAFDSELERVVGGDFSGVVRVWNAADGTEIGQLSTNPPPLAVRLEALSQRVAAAVAASEQATAQLNALQQEMAAKVKAAEDAAAAATAAATRLTEAMTAQTTATATLQETEQALTVAAQTLEAARAAYEDAQKKHEEATTAVATAQATATEAATLAQQAADAAATLKTAAEQAAAAAVPTEEQQQQLAQLQAAAQAAQAQADALRVRAESLQQVQASVTPAAQ